jgi:RNA polymerase sigma-70 factor (ECF subfamily)
MGDRADMLGRDEDAEIWGRARRGDSRALEELRRKYYGELCRFIMRRSDEVDAGEVEARVWLAIWEAREQFRGDSTFKTWLFGIAKFKTLDTLRREQTRQRITEKYIWEQTGAEEERVEERIVEHLAIHDCLKQLEIKLREVIVLCYMMQLNDVAISERLARPLGTVKSQIQAAKRQLRECLQAGEENLEQ